MFVTEADVQAKVKLIAEQLNFTLTSEQVEIIDARTADAYNMIVFELSNQGYAKDQIDIWQAGGTYQSDIAVYYSLLDFLGASVNVDDTTMSKYNRLPELQQDDIVLIDTSGNVMLPEIPQGGSKGLAISDIM